MTTVARGRQFVGFLWAFLALLIGACFALGVGRLATDVPWSWEQRLARVVGPPGLGRDCGPSPVEFAKMLRRIYPIYPADHAFPLSVHFVTSDVVNAYATFGGQVFVTSALLREARSAEELAGVLAHEMEHVRLRHVAGSLLFKVLWLELVRPVSGGATGPRLATVFLDMRFTREQERAADRGAYRRLHDAQVDTRGLMDFFTRTADAGLGDWVSDHPASAERAALGAELRDGVTLPLLSATEWAVVRGVCGG